MEPTLSHSPPGPQPDSRIYLQIGERIFITSASTLTSGSFYFAAAFSNRWQASQSSAEDPFWVDADPDLFVHILRYLRNSVIPIFYNQSHGFDYGLYNALQNQAAFFLIEPLVTWIKEKRYLDAVTIHYATTELRGPGPQIAGYDAILYGNTERSYYPSWGTKKFYECPRGINSHMEHPSVCGRACEKAMGEEGGYSEVDGTGG